MSKEIKKISLGEKNGKDQYVFIRFSDGSSEKYLIKDFPYPNGGPVILGSYEMELISKK